MKKNPTPPARSRIILPMVLAIALATGLGTGTVLQGQLIDCRTTDSWLCRTLVPHARTSLQDPSNPTVGRSRFLEFLRSMNILSDGWVDPEPVVPAVQPVSTSVPVVPVVSAPLVPSTPSAPAASTNTVVTASPRPVLFPGEERCEFEAPAPTLCVTGQFPRFIPVSCTNGTDTGWMYTCDNLPPPVGIPVPPVNIPVCGNGILDANEECDAGPENSSTGDQCRPNCLLPFCGDGEIGPGEQCDDANDVLNDGCAFCRTSICGDGIAESGECGEAPAQSCAPGAFCSTFRFYCGLDCPELPAR